MRGYRIIKKGKDDGIPSGEADVLDDIQQLHDENPRIRQWVPDGQRALHSGPLHT